MSYYCSTVFILHDDYFQISLGIKGIQVIQYGAKVSDRGKSGRVELVQLSLERALTARITVPPCRVLNLPVLEK